MEQYFSLMLKNFTASSSQNSNEDVSDQDDAADLFANNDLHYQVPFWIGVIVISLLFLSAIIGIIRYCLHALCSTHTEIDKTALMTPTSPCLSPRVTNTNQRSKMNLHQSSSSGQFRDHSSNISIRPIKRQHAKFDTETHHYFSPNEFQTSTGLRKKMHDIYVLPVSPTLSSSSSTTNTDEINKSNSYTISNQSRQLRSSSNKFHPTDTFDGVNNDCFTDSPQIKYRTLRRVAAPSQPPPLPPIDTQIHDEIQITRTHPPRVPCRSQKPLSIPIDFEGQTKQSDSIDIQLSTNSSPTNDHSEHAWPNPPESMTTSHQSRPSSIPYDHLLITSNSIIHLNSTNEHFPPYEHSMLTESNT